ncbi:DUF2961 domain-containing protein [bacterium]|nr:DUF2961 domain-containing protein [bacterium]
MSRLFFASIWLFILPCLDGREAAGDGLELARVRPAARTGLANAGWGLDRYKELHGLRPHESQVIADLSGPGVIRQIHITHTRRQEDIVLEIRFDDAAEPAVLCPMTFFFCNARLNTSVIENSPGSWNAYFPMPFKKRAQVMLRNDGEREILFYSFVEWETLPKWDKTLGYFHATYDRKIFQLTRDSEVVLFETAGRGQFIGRHWTVTTDEPVFNEWMALMEGNNEVDIDSVERVVDYLGSEDSFNFSWGWQGTWFGLRSGITENRQGKLSVYRFHPDMPLRFAKSFRWTLNFRFERYGANMNTDEARAKNSHWVNYQTVHYWYLDQPGGYRHAPLAPLEERKQELIKGVASAP